MDVLYAWSFLNIHAGKHTLCLLAGQCWKQVDHKGLTALAEQGLKGRNCRTGLFKPWTLKSTERVPTLMWGSIIHPKDVHVHLLLEGKWEARSWVLAVCCPTSFLHVSNEQEKLLSPQGLCLRLSLPLPVHSQDTNSDEALQYMFTTGKKKRIFGQCQGFH